MPNNRLMVFVDGSNFLIELSHCINVKFRADKPPWLAIQLATTLIQTLISYRPFLVVRKYWFSSYQGNEEYFDEYRSQLRQHGYEPVLFSKRTGREKGVDIALTKEMLVNAFNQNFDYSILIAGDEDYVGLVNETKRYGQIIEGAFFSNGLSENLKLSFDKFTFFQGSMYDDTIQKYTVKIEAFMKGK